MNQVSQINNNRIYLDNAAATPLDHRVKRAMDPFLTDEYGNAGGLYLEGRHAKDALDSARERVASIFNCKPAEIVFTSGGTEGDALALIGVAHAKKHGHIITTKIEHHAVLETCEALEREGFEVTYVEVESNGIVDPKKIEAAIRKDTFLVSVMYANNEIGTIQPIKECSNILKKIEMSLGHKILFHTDACQASEYLDLDVQKLGVDLMTINGSKVYGPKGVGALYIRSGIQIKPMLYGGAQEGKRRAGTENIASIVGLSVALERAESRKQREVKRLSLLRDYFISRLTTEIKRTILNGDPNLRLPNNVNVSILDIEGEATILYLDNYGVACSTGSACTSESLDPSHVILALGRPYEHAHASIRFSLGRMTKKSDIDFVMKKLPKVVETLRRISPITVEEDAKSMSHPEAFAGENLRVKANSKNYK
jgi:cysteine desulfurase